MQTRLSSLLEAVANTLSGFALAVVIQLMITWWKHLPLSFGENVGITLIFTVASLVRSYLWRRFFNYLIHRSSSY